MSQIGKLYKFYFGKIWQKNWLRIIIFTILIGIVWWFVIPWAGLQVLKNIRERGSEFSEKQREEKEKEENFSEVARELLQDQVGGVIDRKEIRNLLEDEEQWKEWTKKHQKIGTQIRLARWGLRMVDSSTYLGILSFPFNSNNAFFCSQTEGYNNMGEKGFWKLLLDISWWNLTGFLVLYWFIFEVFDKTFFSPRGDGEETTVLTMTPGVKRSDVIWGKILAFLTFYFLINIILFLIPFSIYYWWLASAPQLSWFALLTLITIIVGPLLFFGLIFVPHLFFGSLTGQKWIFSTLVVFFPFLWGGLKLLSSAAWPYTVEKTFFDPIWFTVISLVCGLFFFTLYYLRYQEEDLG